MLKNIVLSGILLVAVRCAWAEVRIELKTGQVLVVEKARISDGGVMVMVDKKLKKVPYSEISDKSIEALGAGRLAAEAARPKVAEAPTAVPPAESQRAAKPVFKEKTKPKLDPSDAALIRKLMADLDAKCGECEAEIRRRFSEASQQQPGFDALNTNKAQVAAVIAELRTGLTQAAVETVVQTHLGKIQIQRRLQSDGKLGLGFHKTLFAAQRAVFGMEFGSDGLVKSWSCEFQRVGR